MLNGVNLNWYIFFFVFQWHLLQPERRVVCVGKLKTVVRAHLVIIPRFCRSHSSLWNTNVTCALGGTLKISITKSMAIIIVAITWFASGWDVLLYSYIKDSSFFNYQVIKPLNANVKKWYSQISRCNFDMSIVYSTLFDYNMLCHFSHVFRRITYYYYYGTMIAFVYYERFSVVFNREISQILETTLLKLR